MGRRQPKNPGFPPPRELVVNHAAAHVATNIKENNRNKVRVEEKSSYYEKDAFNLGTASLR